VGRVERENGGERWRSVVVVVTERLQTRKSKQPNPAQSTVGHNKAEICKHANQRMHA